MKDLLRNSDSSARSNIQLAAEVDHDHDGDHDHDDEVRSITMMLLPVTASTKSQDEADLWGCASDITDVTPLTPLNDQYREALRSVMVRDGRNTIREEPPTVGPIRNASMNYHEGSTSIGGLGRLPPPMEPPKDDALVLAQARQSTSAGRQTRGSVTQFIPSMTASFQSPENWQTTRRVRYDNQDSYIVDNRSRIPHMAITNQGSRNNDEDDNDDNDDDSRESSSPMQYIPSHHLRSTMANPPATFVPTRSLSMSNPRQRRSVQPHHLQSPNFPSPMDDRSVASNSSHSTTRSRRSTHSYRSSTSLSLLHGEVINLEAKIRNGPMDSRTRRQSRGETSALVSAYGHTPSRSRFGGSIQPCNTQGQDDVESQHRQHALAGMEIGGDGDESLATPLKLPPGIPIAMTPGGSLYSYDDPSTNGPLISWGIAAEHIASMRSKARHFRENATNGVVRLKDKTTLLTQTMMQYYRPPLSPRSRELKDLQYLQQSHKEKVGQWMLHSNSINANETMEYEAADGFINDDDFFDFLIILTPQEVYKYWADLLDFREEHFGDSISNGLGDQGRHKQDPSDAASTNTTESRTTEERSDDIVQSKQEVAGENGYDRDHGDHDIYDSDQDDDAYECIEKHDFTTPLKGLLRRRGGRLATPHEVSAAKSITTVRQSTQRRTSMTSLSRSMNQSSNRMYTSQSLAFSPGGSSKRLKMSMFERAIHSPLLTQGGESTSNRQRTFSAHSYSNNDSSKTGDNDEEVIASTLADADHGQRSSISNVRRKWGNRTLPAQSGSMTANMLSPPIRSLTRGGGSVSKLFKTPTKLIRDERTGPNIKDANGCGAEDTDVEGDAIVGNEENVNPNCIKSENDIPNPIVPRGIATRTNGMLKFLSALKRGIVVRRHRVNNDAIYCKIMSHDGGDTIQYQLIDPEEAMVAFKEQRVRYNRTLTHSSSPATVRAVTSEWSCLDGPGEGSPVHKFKVPDHVAAQRYRQKLHRENGVASRLFDVATKAANSGIIRAADLVAVHPASHWDPRHPGVRKGELGTASLRRSLSHYSIPHTFSLVLTAGQRFKKGASGQQVELGNGNKWYSGEGSELQFKTLDFEAASEGEYWLFLRGFILLHRDVKVGRFAANRSAGIGGGTRINTNNQDDRGSNLFENRLQRDMFIEPVTVSSLEKLVVKIRKKDDTYMKGMVIPGAVPPPSDYFLGFKAPGTQIWSRLRLAGLETQRVYSVDTRRVMIKVRCPEDRLTDVAEVLRLKLKTTDGSFAPFREETWQMFESREDILDVPNIYRNGMASLLRSKDRQMIIDFIIGSRIRDSGAELGRSSDVGKMIQARIPLHMPQKLDSLCEAWVFYWRRERWTGPDRKGKIPGEGNSRKGTGSLSIEEGHTQARLFNDERPIAGDDLPVPNFLTRFFVEAFYQPLDAVQDYYGEQVTYYFAWLQHCAIHLLFLAFFGVIITLFQMSTDDFDHPLRPYFSIVVMLWTFVVLVNWRKRSNYLAYKWGSMDHKEQETTRPEFHGEYVIDPITSEWEIKYPKWKRWVKYSISVPITVFFTALAVMLILLVHKNRDLHMRQYIEQKTNPNADPYTFDFSLKNVGPAEIIEDLHLTKDQLFDPTYWFIMGAMPAFLGLCIPILNLILMRIRYVNPVLQGVCCCFKYFREFERSTNNE
jgi:hypothetical protein